MFIVLSVSSGPFFTKVNLLDILDQQAATLIIAAAGTLVLVAGGPGRGHRRLAGAQRPGLQRRDHAHLYRAAGIVVGGTSILVGILLLAVGYDAWSRLRQS